MSKPENVIVFNIASTTKVKMLPVEEVPTLISNTIMADLQGDDTAPFFKIEAIEYPANGAGGIYTKAFFNSFIGVIKKRPIPGSKRGHEWISRGKSDFYTVGGLLVDNEDGKTGVVYLKIYIPQKGDETENSGFIRDAKAGIVHFSLVSAPESVTKIDPDTGNNVRYYTASKGYERNDAMEYGAGAMKQIVNSQGSPLDVDAAKALIESGQFDIKSDVEGDAIQNGRVYRSALRRLASRANEEDRTVIGELISMIDKPKNGGKSVEKTEIFEALKNLVANAKTNLGEIAEAVGLKALMRNEADDANAETVKALNAKLGEKPIEALDAMIAENKANAVAVVENAITNTLKIPKVIVNEKDGVKTEVANPSFDYAFAQVNGKKGVELAAAVEALKKNTVMLALQANAADGGSSVYQVAPDHNSDASHVENSDGIETIVVGRK